MPIGSLSVSNRMVDAFCSATMHTIGVGCAFNAQEVSTLDVARRRHRRGVCCRGRERLRYRSECFFISAAALGWVSHVIACSIWAPPDLSQDLTQSPTRLDLDLCRFGTRAAAAFGAATDWNKTTRRTTTVAADERIHCRIQCHTGHGPGRMHPPGQCHHSSWMRAAIAWESCNVRCWLLESVAGRALGCPPPVCADFRRHSAGE